MTDELEDEPTDEKIKRLEARRATYRGALWQRARIVDIGALTEWEAARGQEVWVETGPPHVNKLATIDAHGQVVGDITVEWVVLSNLIMNSNHQQYGRYIALPAWAVERLGYDCDCFRMAVEEVPWCDWTRQLGIAA